MEVYSPERVAKLCKKHVSTSGFSLDLTNGYGFDKAEDRERAWEIIRRDKPHTVIGSPPCTYLSSLQELNRCLYKDDPVWMEKLDDNLRKAKRHVKCCCPIYRYQVEGKRHVLREHPWLAGSWSSYCVADLEKMPGVERVRLDMCQYGMTDDEPLATSRT